MRFIYNALVVVAAMLLSAVILAVSVPLLINVMLHWL